MPATVVATAPEFVAEIVLMVFWSMLAPYGEAPVWRMPWTAVPPPATVVFAAAPAISRMVLSEIVAAPGLAVALTPGAWI